MPNRNGSAPGKRCHIVLIPGFGGFDALGRANGSQGLFRKFPAPTPDGAHSS